MRFVRLVAVLLAALLVVAGCGGQARDAGPGGTPDPAAADEPGDQAPAGEAVLIIGRQDDGNSYDPHKGTNFAALEVLHALYDTLVTVDYDLKTIRPLLATEWQISEDGKEYTFKLRDDVKFHSGRPMTAEDVKYSFDRLRDPANNFSESWVLESVEEVIAVDDTTVVLKLKHPDGELLLNLARSQAAILDREAVEQWGEDFGVLWSGGTGPFKWVKWEPEKEVVLERNPDYAWGSEVFKNTGAPHVDRLIFRTIPDPNTRMLALETGEIHATRHVPLTEVDRLRDLEGVEIVPFERLHSWFLGMNLRKPIFADQRVRQALSKALDRQAIIDLAANGFGVPAQNMISPATPGYWEGAAEAGHEHDPEEARRLLDEAGWTVGPDGIRQKDGVRLSFALHGTKDTETLLTVIQAQFREVGVEANLDIMEIGALFEKIGGEDHDMHVMGFSYASAGEAFNLYFHSSNVPSPNRFNWVDAETDRLLEAGKAAVTDEERREAYDKVQEIILEATPIIPLYHTVGFIAVRSEVQDFRPHGLFGLGFLKMTDPRLGGQ